MEKKTLGSFLSILRKAKGMTQRELAELLNVSDKAVSRWERDESMPDILLLPVIADIFDVSCDDLLRGERKGTEAYQETPEKRIQRTNILTQTSHIKKWVRTLKNQYFSSQNSNYAAHSPYNMAFCIYFGSL